MPRRAEFSGFEEFIREFWRVWGDEGVDALLSRYEDFFAEDAVWSPPVAQVAGHDYVGRTGFAEYVNEFHDTFKGFSGKVEPGSELEVSADLWRFAVLVSAEPRDGGRLDANLIALVRMYDGRMIYAWGSYDPEAAERKIADLRAGTEAVDA